jgi:hypothetical protein
MVARRRALSPQGTVRRRYAGSEARPREQVTTRNETFRRVERPALRHYVLAGSPVYTLLLVFTPASSRNGVSMWRADHVRGIAVEGHAAQCQFAVHVHAGPSLHTDTALLSKIPSERPRDPTRPSAAWSPGQEERAPSLSTAMASGRTLVRARAPWRRARGRNRVGDAIRDLAAGQVRDAKEENPFTLILLLPCCRRLRRARYVGGSRSHRPRLHR